MSLERPPKQERRLANAKQYEQAAKGELSAHHYTNSRTGEVTRVFFTHPNVNLTIEQQNYGQVGFERDGNVAVETPAKYAGVLSIEDCLSRARELVKLASENQ